MGGPEIAPAAAPAARRLRVVAILAWAAFAFVVWNVVFDAGVIQSGRDYLTRQALHQQGRGPSVTIRQVMDPGVARAARDATRAGGAVGGAGVLVVWLISRRRAGRSAGRRQ
jgi:hypothetical protein